MFTLTAKVARSVSLGLFLSLACGVYADSPLLCQPTPERHAYLIPASASEKGLASTDGVEVFKGNGYIETLSNGWQFALLATEYGWTIRVYDQPYTNGRVDLSAITPPLHSSANPRDLAGWHFRNQSNTGPNQGDVNAPQRTRLFQFDGALAGTGGLRSSGGESVSANTGRGQLQILDLALTEHQLDAKARMTYLKFQTCLTWPRLSKAEELVRSAEHERRARMLDAQVLTYSEIDQETFGKCGLDLSLYKLDASVIPRLIGFDIDGDGAQDEIAQVTRRQDNARGLALCRAGTWLHLLGFNEHFGAATRHLLSSMESWRVVARDHGPFGYVDEMPWPEPTGDVLLVERIEKGMAMFFWRNGSVQTQKVYGMTPN